MNINNNQEILSRSLVELTYNGEDLMRELRGLRSNIYMGLGLWSKKNGLSQGLPVDVMQMLLPAAVLRQAMLEAHPLCDSRIIILIAESMAIREGANRDQVSKIVELYKKSLERLLEMLNIRQCTEIVLTSSIEQTTDFEAIRTSLEGKKTVKEMRRKDPDHCIYQITQTAMSYYMHLNQNVGIKVGWSLNKAGSWDEPRFDKVYAKIFPESNLKYLYVKAGVKLINADWRGGCPYTAFKDDSSCIVQIEGDAKIDRSYCDQALVKNHWKGVAKLCSDLATASFVNASILPEDCIREDDISTIHRLLNHWAKGRSISHALTDKPLLLSLGPRKRLRTECVWIER
jgi:hypothetical protein